MWRPSPCAKSSACSRRWPRVELLRKAWLFLGSPSGGETAAIFYTLTATCRRLHIDPLAYLSDLFTRWPTCDPTDESSLAAFLPDRWLAAHPEAKLPMREEESQQKAAKKRARRTHLRAALAQAEHQRLVTPSPIEIPQKPKQKSRRHGCNAHTRANGGPALTITSLMPRPGREFRRSEVGDGIKPMSFFTAASLSPAVIAATRSREKRSPRS